jgi:hypothetical protein
MMEEGDGLTKVQLPDGEAVPPEEQVTAIIGRMAPERGQEDASLAPGCWVMEAAEQCLELPVGGVAGGLAPLQEIHHHALAAHFLLQLIINNREIGSFSFS